MRILITGSTGFVGSHLTRELVGSGHEVAVLVVPDDPARRLQEFFSRLTVWRGNLRDLAPITPVIVAWAPEACIHLAWYTEPGSYLHSSENVRALFASVNLLQTLAAAGCRHFVGAGTCAEYDMSQGVLREDGPTKPATLYAAAKLSLCFMGEQIASRAGMQFAWGRIFYPYGPGEDPRRLVPSAIRALRKQEMFLATDGKQVRDYIHVSDIASAFQVLVEQRVSGAINLCSGQPVTVRQLLENLGDLMGASHLLRFGARPYRSWDPPFICGDSTKLRALGWQPRFGLREGLAETVSWWNDNPE